MMQAARVPKGRYAYFVELHIEQVVQMGRVLTRFFLSCHAPIVSCATEYAHWYKCIAITYD
jgi:hypothetical protein